MKKALLLSYLLCIIYPLYSQWTIEQLPTPRTRMAGVFAGGKVFFAGGLSELFPQSVVSNVVDIYDISTDSWTSTQLSVARADIGTVVLGDKILFAGGISNAEDGIFRNLDVMDIYNVPTGNWSQTSLPGKATSISIAVIGDKAYMMMGEGDDFYDIWVYDGISGNWSTLQLPGGNRKGVAMAAIGSKLLCVGGYDFNTSSRIDIYDTDSGTWSLKMLWEPRYNIRTLVDENKCYMIGGEGDINAEYTMEIYNQETDELQVVALPAPLSNHGVAIYGDEIMMGGNGTISPQIYNTTTDTWIQLGTSGLFPDLDMHYRATVVSTSIGVFFAGGETGNVGEVESQVFIRSGTVSSKELAYKNLLIYPSIVATRMTVTFPISDISEHNFPIILVADLSGQSYPVELIAVSESSIELSTEKLPDGNYVINIGTGDRVFVGRFVKLKN